MLELDSINVAKLDELRIRYNVLMRIAKLGQIPVPQNKAEL